MTLCEKERPLVSKILKGTHPHFTNGLIGVSMFRRFTIAILSILISGLKLICNMLSLCITRITKQEMPLFGLNVDEMEESIKRSHYVVENDRDEEFQANSFEEAPYENPIKY